MLREVVLPAWCKKVGVGADAAYPSRANLQAIDARVGIDQKERKSFVEARTIGRFIAHASGALVVSQK